MKTEANTSDAWSGLKLPRLSGMVKKLKGKRYASADHHHETIFNAASIIGDAAHKIARADANHYAKSLNTRAPYSDKKYIAKTREVEPTGDPETDSKNIQNAIDISSVGDRVLLGSGIFHLGSPIWIWKDIIIAGSRGTIIEGIINDKGKVLSDSGRNSAFFLTNNIATWIHNLHFRNLYSAISSISGARHISFENNICEDVYHCVYVTNDLNDSLRTSRISRSPKTEFNENTELIARNNRIHLSSLDPNDSKCRMNFFDESHVFGFALHGKINALIEHNKLEVNHLSANAPFHAVGIFCSHDSGKIVVRKNLLKGWHAPIAVHSSAYPSIYSNEINSICPDSEFAPFGIVVRDCSHASVFSNKIESRGISKGASGIVFHSSNDGKIIDNHISIHNGESGILLHASDGIIIGKNQIGKSLARSIGLFGDQSEEVKDNLVFENLLHGEGKIDLAYAKDNLVLGLHSVKNEDPSNALYGKISDSIERSPNFHMEHAKRKARLLEHKGKSVWPSAPREYKRERW